MKNIALIFVTAFLFSIPLFANEKSAFVSLNEVDPSIIVDMRYFGKHNFIGRQIKGYRAPKCLLTKESAEALTEVQKELKQKSLSLKIYDCYRPQKAVNDFAQWTKNLQNTDMKKEFYPEEPKETLFDRGYIAYKSGHSRGSTMDLTIVPLPATEEEIYHEGQPLVECFAPETKRFKDSSIDMGTGYDCFSTLSNTDDKRIRGLQRKNRQLLKTIMEKHGFKNYDKEWWHYTLKNEPFPDRYFNFNVK
ncbi:MAG: M15 family metallopeptidase [Deltaproteobacteria bacterium]|nr:M15 family metallopeptidase [Deltaproteobacteria bacterium]